MNLETSRGAFTNSALEIDPQMKHFQKCMNVCYITHTIQIQSCGPSIKNFLTNHPAFVINIKKPKFAITFRPTI